MNEEFNGGFVHGIDFGKRQGAAHQPSQTLAQRIVESLDVVSLALPLTGLVLVWRQDSLIGFPKVAVAQTVFVAVRDALPQQTAGFDTARTQSIGHDLPGATAQSQPQPPFIFALFDK